MLKKNIFCILMVLVMIFCAVPMQGLAEEKAIIYDNFDTEESINNWNGNRKWVNAPTYNNSNGALYFEVKNNNLEFSRRSIELTKGLYYKISFYVRLEDNAPDSVAQIVLIQSNGKAKYIAAKTPVNSKDWTLVSDFYCDDSDGTGINSVFLRIGDNPEKNKINYYFDEFSVEPVYGSDIHFDGEDIMIIPEDKAADYTYDVYSVNDEYKDTIRTTYRMNNENIHWSFKEELPDGVAFNEKTQTFTVSCNAEENDINAVCSTDNNVEVLHTFKIRSIETEYNSLLNKLMNLSVTAREQLEEELKQLREEYGSAPEGENTVKAYEKLKELYVKYTEPYSSECLEKPSKEAENLLSQVCETKEYKELATAKEKADEYLGKKVNSQEEILAAKNTLEDAIYSFRCAVTPYRGFYVDCKNGKDNNDGTAEKPFKSIEAARDAAAQISDNMNGDIIIYIRGGIYAYPEKQLIFGSENSGKNGYNIIYKAYDGENPVISGGIEVKNWEIYDEQKGIYRAYVGRYTSRQFYVNGARRIRARSESGLTNAKYDDGEYGYTDCDDTYLLDYKNISNAELVYETIWTNSRCMIESVTADGDKVKIKMQQPGWYDVRNKGATSVKEPVYIENAYELLDMPGEWYKNESDGYIYYMPYEGEKINTAILPVADAETVLIKGDDADKTADNIIFDGISFEYMTWMRPSTGSGHSDAQNNHIRDSEYSDELAPGSVAVKYAHSIEFRDCVFSHLGINALQMIKCIQDCTVEGNRFYDISGSAMNLGEPSLKLIDEYPNYNYNPSDSKFYISNNRITDNYITNIGVDYKSSAAISAGFPTDTEIAYNTIENVPYSGMHIGYGWKSIKTSIIKNVSIHHNKIINAMNGLADGAGIYVIGPTGGTEEKPNKIYKNYINNNYESDTAHLALYTDQGASFWTLENNVCSTHTKNDEKRENAWFSNLSAENNDLTVRNNYVTTKHKNFTDYGENNEVYGEKICLNGEFPSEAEKIIKESGTKKDGNIRISLYSNDNKPDTSHSETFFKDTKGWTLANNANIQSSWNENGTSGTGGCVKTVYPSGTAYNNGYVGAYKKIEIRRDTWYELSAKVKLDNFEDSVKTPKENAYATIFLTNMEGVDGYIKCISDTPIEVKQNNDGTYDSEWTEIRGYFKFSGNENVKHITPRIQIRVGKDGQNTQFNYFIDDVNIKEAGIVANGDFEEEYSSKGYFSLAASKGLSRLEAWDTTSGKITDQQAYSGKKSMLVNEGAPSSSMRGAEQYVNLEEGKRYKIKVWVKAKYLKGSNVKINSSICFAPKTYYTENDRRVFGEFDEERISQSVNINDREWHLIETEYTAGIDEKYRELDFADAGGMIFVKSVCEEDGKENSETAAFYMDDFCIEPIEERTVNVIAENTSAYDKNFNVIKSVHDNDTLKKIEESNLYVKAFDSVSENISYGTSETEKLFVWDDIQTPLLNKIILNR